MTRRIVATVAVLLLNLPVARAQSQSSNDPWFRKSPKPNDFVVAKLPWRTFSIELPKNWQMAPAYGGILLSATERTKNNQPAASIVLEQMLLVAVLRNDEIDDGLATFESNATKQRDPAGQDFQQQVKEIDGRRFVFIRYFRPGFTGTDAVVQYAIPNGNVMYRLICIAPSAQLAAKYQATFAHVAQSFKLAATNTN